VEVGPTSQAARRPRGRPARVSRQQIVEAAIRLFALYGYRRTTIAGIAKSLGVTDGSVLHYFEGKRAILEAALETENVPADAALTAYLARGGIEALRGLASWGAYMEAHPESTSMHLLLSAEALGEGSELNGQFDERYRRLARRLSAALRKGIESGEIKPDVDVEHEALALIAFTDGARLQWMMSRRTYPLAQHVRVYVTHLIERIALSSGGIVAAQARGADSGTGRSPGTRASTRAPHRS
jgi:AcrR family transcriptional regulator